MEVQVDTSEHSETLEKITEFLTKVTIDRIGDHKYVIHFEGNLRKFELQVGDIIGFLLFYWYMSTEEHKQLEKDAQDKKKSGYSV